MTGRPRMRALREAAAAAALLALLASCQAIPEPPPLPADSLPGELADAEFWRIVTEFSEPGGPFPYENFVSNEVAYQSVLPELTRRVQPGGVYLGVASEQNFTYIAALRSKLAFIVDIRRQNMLEHLMYKALFEMSPGRVEFVSRLFSRRLPPGLDEDVTAEDLFGAAGRADPDQRLYDETLSAVTRRLVGERALDLSLEDLDTIAHVLDVFRRGGPGMDYTFDSASPNSSVPSYYRLMTSVDRSGRNWAYLADEAAYRFVRGRHARNLIVPLVGDFSGTKTLKAVADYLVGHGAVVTVFYISNVEDYIEAS